MWPILEPVLMLLAGLVIFTQIVLPPLIGKNFFWLFRKSEKRIHDKEAELATLRDEATIVELNQRMKEEKDKINKEMIK